MLRFFGGDEKSEGGGRRKEERLESSELVFLSCLLRAADPSVCKTADEDEGVDEGEGEEDERDGER